jgi:hypothetical protein
MVARVQGGAHAFGNSQVRLAEASPCGQHPEAMRVVEDRHLRRVQPEPNFNRL